MPIPCQNRPIRRPNTLFFRALRLPGPGETSLPLFADFDPLFADFDPLFADLDPLFAEFRHILLRFAPLWTPVAVVGRIVRWGKGETAGNSFGWGEKVIPPQNLSQKYKLFPEKSRPVLGDLMKRF